MIDTSLWRLVYGADEILVRLNRLVYLPVTRR